MTSLVRRLFRSDSVINAAPEVKLEPIREEPAVPSTITAISSDPTGPVAGKVESLSDLKPHLIDFLYNNSNPVMAKIFELAEQKSSVPREMIFGGVLLLGVVYLIVGASAQLLCNLIGFGYPAYASVLAIRSIDKNDDTTWLIYWVVFASFSLLDFYAEVIMGVVPLYWIGKALVLLYLALPQTSGASTIYWNYIDPFVTKFENSARKWAMT